jgi:hypothetical protein
MDQLSGETRITKASVIRFFIWVTIAAATNVALGWASIRAADTFPDGAVRATLQAGIVVSVAVGLMVLDRGYRKKTLPVTPLYITGILCYLAALGVVFFRILIFSAAGRGRLDL